MEKLQDYTCKRIILIAPEGPNMSWFLGLSGHVEPDPFVPAQPVYSTIYSDPSLEFVKPESSCLALRNSAIKEQGFSEATAA